MGAILVAWRFNAAFPRCKWILDTNQALSVEMNEGLEPTYNT